MYWILNDVIANYFKLWYTKFQHILELDSEPVWGSMQVMRRIRARRMPQGYDELIELTFILTYNVSKQINTGSYLILRKGTKRCMHECHILYETMSALFLFNFHSHRHLKRKLVKAHKRLIDNFFQPVKIYRVNSTRRWIWNDRCLLPSIEIEKNDVLNQLIFCLKKG